jgi:glycosyltransferase involved in cell wall biosynthesis
MNKILHIIVGLNSGGAEIMLSRLVIGAENVDNIIISLTSLGPIGDNLKKRRFQVYSLNLNVFNFFYKILYLVKLIKQINPDVVQTWMYHSDFIGGLAAKIAGVKKIFWNIRNTEIPQKAFSRTGFIIRICALLSGYIPNKIICCAFSALDKHSALGYSRSEMVVIPNGYQKTYGEKFDKRHEVRTKLGLSSDVLVIGVVGRYDFLKGYDILISAASLFSKSYQGEFIFTCVGRHIDQNNPELMELLNDSSLKNNFLLMGESSNVEEIYSVMDFYCLPSRSEGFPNVVAEAMLCRLPCVVTDVGDAARIIGKTGIVVEPKNVESLASGLLRMAEFSFEKRKELGVLARSQIIENYEIGKIISQYMAVYEMKGEYIS